MLLEHQTNLRNDFVIGVFFIKAMGVSVAVAKIAPWFGIARLNVLRPGLRPTELVVPG